MSEPRFITHAESERELTIKSLSVTLTNAQILTLPTIPVEIISAPGEGSQILIVAGLCTLDNTAGVYDNVDTNCEFFLTQNSGNQYASTGIDIGWAMTDGSESVVAELSIITFMSVPDSLPAFGLKPVGYSDYKSSKENQPIRLFVNNHSAGNFGAGNDANTLKVTVYYAVLVL